MPLPQLRTYREFPIERPRPNSDLYALSDRLIAEDVVAIVGIEGPIHGDLLYQRMAKLYSIERAGSEVRRVVDRALREATRTGSVVRRGKFYWAGGAEQIEPRLAGPRNIEQIDPRELGDVIVQVLAGDGPQVRMDLIRATARALGFQRTGSSLTTGINAMIDTLIADGRVHQRDGKLA